MFSFHVLTITVRLNATLSITFLSSAEQNVDLCIPVSLYTGLPLYSGRSHTEGVPQEGSVYSGGNKPLGPTNLVFVFSSTVGQYCTDHCCVIIILKKTIQVMDIMLFNFGRDEDLAKWLGENEVMWNVQSV